MDGAAGKEVIVEADDIEEDRLVVEKKFRKERKVLGE